MYSDDEWVFDFCVWECACSCVWRPWADKQISCLGPRESGAPELAPWHCIENGGLQNWGPRIGPIALYWEWWDCRWFRPVPGQRCQWPCVYSIVCLCLFVYANICVSVFVCLHASLYKNDWDRSKRARWSGLNAAKFRGSFDWQEHVENCHNQYPS